MQHSPFSSAAAALHSALPVLRELHGMQLCPRPHAEGLWVPTWGVWEGFGELLALGWELMLHSSVVVSSYWEGAVHGSALHEEEAG